MTGTPHRATAEQWNRLQGRRLASDHVSAIIELRARVEALEAGATCPHVVSSDEGTSYCGLAEQQANSQPTPNDRQIRSSPAGQFELSDDDPIPQRPTPAGSLVEQVVEAMRCAGPSYTPEARAAIRAVAEWLRGQQVLGARAWAWHLEQEVER